MHPAFSIILFTTLSGAGLGLAFWNALLPTDSATSAIAAAVALSLTSGGLCCSVFHLRRPDRAWRAFSQWRSSWLSREGILAPITLAAIALHAIALPDIAAIRTALGVPVAALSVATVFATAMIYTQLRAVPAWATPWTPVCFLILSASGGAHFLAGISAWTGSYRPFFTILTGLLILLAWISLALWWRHRDRIGTGPATIESATGLRSPGGVRLLEPPHTGANYLTREMVFVIARRHALKLRFIAFTTGALFPLMLIGAALLAYPAICLTAAAALHLLAVVISRWLFFAEATHTVSLYYGSSN